MSNFFQKPSYGGNDNKPEPTMDAIDLSAFRNADMKTMSLGGMLNMDESGDLSTTYGQTKNPIAKELMTHMDSRNALTYQHEALSANATTKSGYWNDANRIRELEGDISRERKELARGIMKIDNATLSALSKDEYASVLDASVTSNDWNPNISGKESISNDLLLRQAATRELTDIMNAKDPDEIAKLIDKKVNKDTAITQALSSDNRNTVMDTYKQKYPDLFTPEAVEERNKQADKVLQTAAEKEPRIDVRNPFAVQDLLNQTSREAYLAEIKAETKALTEDKNLSAQTAKPIQPTMARFASTGFDNFSAGDNSNQYGN